MKNILFSVAVIAAMAPAAHAALVSLVDASFESQPAATVFPNTDQGVDGGWWHNTTRFPGSSAGVLYINDGSSGDGSRNALLGYASELRGLEQTVSTTFAAGTDYSLTAYGRAVAYGAFADNTTARLGMELYGATTGTVVLQQTFDIVTGQTGALGDRTMTVSAADVLSAGVIGEGIGIRLFKNGLYPAEGDSTSANIELRVDEVRLDAVPEPAVAGLLALGCLLGLRRRRRQA